MLRREYKWKGLNILEIHYLDNISAFLENYYLKNIDVIKLYQVKENYQNKLEEFYTLHIDLKEDKDDIFKKFYSNTRNEIRKNLKDDEVQYSYIQNPNKEKIKIFMDNLKKFMKQKDNDMDYDFLLQQGYNFQNNIIITSVVKDELVLAEHLYLVDETRVRYKSGISYRFDTQIDAKVIGRSNRGLHWYDIQLFKDKKFEIYDFGGIAYNTKDKAKLNINKFKERFTKNQVIEYQGNIGISLKGKLALLAHKVLQKVKS